MYCLFKKMGDGRMKVKKLREYLKGLKDSDDFLISCDEELNVLYKDGEIAEIGKNKYVIYGFSGTEEE